MLSGVCPAGFRALPLALLSTEQLAQRPGQSQTESLRGALLQHRDRRNRQRTAAVLPRVIRWKMANNLAQRLMLFLTQGFGILGALAMLLSGLYPINFPALHGFFSMCLYILLGTAFAFSVAALRYHAALPRWLLIVGASTALVDMLYGVLHMVYVLEWVTTALLLCYLGLLGGQ